MILPEVTEGGSKSQKPKLQTPKKLQIPFSKALGFGPSRISTGFIVTYASVAFGPLGFGISSENQISPSCARRHACAWPGATSFSWTGVVMHFSAANSH